MTSLFQDGMKCHYHGYRPNGTIYTMGEIRLIRLRHLWVILLYMAVMAIVGCRNDDPEVVNSAGTASQLRIVSFSPAITRALVDLDLEEKIVGRSTFCTSLPTDIPVVGDLLQINYERLLELQPTHILMQTSREGADTRLLELAEQKGWKIGQWSRINTLADIERMVRAIPDVLYEQESGEHHRMSDKIDTLWRRLDRILHAEASDRWQGPVLLVHHIDPVAVFGRETYLSDLLIALGASNATEVTGWQNLSLEDVSHLNPPAVIIIAETSEDSSVDPWELAGPLGKLKIEAVQTRRFAVLSNPDAWLPSTGVISVAEELREILHQFNQSTIPEQ